MNFISIFNFIYTFDEIAINSEQTKYSQLANTSHGKSHGFLPKKLKKIEK